MGRGHVEVAHVDELPWATGELAPGLAESRYKTLSYDTEDGGFTRYVSVEEGWGGDGVTLDRPHEVYVIDGEIAVDDRSVSDGGYVRVPPDVPVGISADADTLCLWMTGIGPSIDPDVEEPMESDVLVKDTTSMEWEDTFVPGPDPGLYIKLLWKDEDSGAYTRLIRAEKGWAEDRVEHHDCVEEIYTLEGHSDAYETDPMDEGTYVWRPPRIRHGPYEAVEETVFFIRTDGELVNHYTSKDGEPLNYEGPPPERTAADGRSTPITNGES